VAIAYPDAARHFNGRPVRVTLDNQDRQTFTGTLHPAPHDGREHVELRDERHGQCVRVDVDDIADIRPHRRSRR